MENSIIKTTKNPLSPITRNTSLVIEEDWSSTPFLVKKTKKYITLIATDDNELQFNAQKILFSEDDGFLYDKKLFKFDRIKLEELGFDDVETFEELLLTCIETTIPPTEIINVIELFHKYHDIGMILYALRNAELSSTKELSFIDLNSLLFGVEYDEEDDEW